MRKFKVFAISAITASLIASCNFLYASTTSSLQNEQNDLDKQIQAKKSELSNVKTEMSETLNQIVGLNDEITTYQGEINNLQIQIDTLTSQITQKEQNIAEQESKYNSQKEALEKRLVAMYESGSVSYLDMLLSSDGLADFISKYYLIEQLAEYDQELLIKIQNTKDQITTEKNSLEETKNTIKSNQSQIVSKKNSLSDSVNKKEALVTNLSEEEAKIQRELEEFEQDKREIQAELARIAAAEKANGGSVTPVAPSAAGYIFPVAGLSKANINNLNYPSYRGHTGVDVNIGVTGKTIVAVKSGTVVTSKALRRPDGSYKSYGEYVVINHHDGTMTLYAHMYPNSRQVQEGQSVSQGQALGTVGTTGNSTGNHLHFEVRINGSPVNPIPYLP